AHVIRSNHFLGREDRTDLRIKSIEGARSERLRVRPMIFAAGFPLLGLDQDEDGHMTRMGARPLPHLFQTSCKGLASASVVEVLDMHHLEPWLAHHPIRIELRIRRKLRGSNHRGTRGMCVEPALRIRVDVKLNLTDA